MLQWKQFLRQVPCSSAPWLITNHYLQALALIFVEPATGVNLSGADVIRNASTLVTLFEVRASPFDSTSGFSVSGLISAQNVGLKKVGIAIVYFTLRGRRHNVGCAKLLIGGLLQEVAKCWHIICGASCLKTMYYRDGQPSFGLYWRGIIHPLRVVFLPFLQLCRQPRLVAHAVACR